MEILRNSFGDAALAVSFSEVSGATGCFLALEDVEFETSCLKFSFSGSCEVDVCHLLFVWRVEVFPPYIIIMTQFPDLWGK